MKEKTWKRCHTGRQSRSFMPILAVSAAIFAGLMRPNWCVAGIYSAGNPIGRDVITAPAKKAFAGQAYHTTEPEHIDDVASSIGTLGYQVDKSQDLLKADAHNLIRDRLVWYSLSHGVIHKKTHLFFGVDYSHEDPPSVASVFTPSDVPVPQHYTLVFLNGCNSAQPESYTPGHFRTNFGATVYLGWTIDINVATAEVFAGRFFSNLKGRRTVAQAITLTIESFTAHPGLYSGWNSIRVLGDDNTVVEQ